MSDLTTWLLAQLDADEHREHGKRKMPSLRGRLCPVCEEPISAWEASGWPEWPLYELQCGHTLDEVEMREFAPPVPAPDPHVLADIAAKRRILAEHALTAEPGVTVTAFKYSTVTYRCRTCADWDVADYDGPAQVSDPCQTKRLLTLPYRDRPGYDPAWAPSEEAS